MAIYRFPISPPKPRVKFDLFYELSMPPLLARSEAQLFADTLEEWALADRLGFHAAWLVEHHGMPGYSHASKPELFLAAAAMRTERLRLGLGIVPLPYHHPLHVAERVATLDLLSGGRVEFGIGRGFAPAEYAAFGVAMADSRARTEEALRIVREGLARGRVSFGPGDGIGHATDMAVVPAPLQKPHPPLWTAAVSPDSFDWAAREGLDVLAGPFKPWFMVNEDIRRFQGAWDAHQPGRAPRIGMTVGMLCLPDGSEARRRAAAALTWFYGELLAHTRPVLERLVPGYEHFHHLGRFRRLLALGARPKLLELAGMTLVGSPAECVARIARLRDAGVTHLLCAIGAGAVDTALVRDSMQCIAEEVMPHFTPD